MRFVISLKLYDFQRERYFIDIHELVQCYLVLFRFEFDLIPLVDSTSSITVAFYPQIRCL